MPPAEPRTYCRTCERLPVQCHRCLYWYEYVLKVRIEAMTTRSCSSCGMWWAGWVPDSQALYAAWKYPSEISCGRCARYGCEICSGDREVEGIGGRVVCCPCTDPEHAQRVELRVAALRRADAESSE